MLFALYAIADFKTERVEDTAKIRKVVFFFPRHQYRWKHAYTDAVLLFLSKAKDLIVDNRS